MQEEQSIIAAKNEENQDHQIDGLIADLCHSSTNFDRFFERLNEARIMQEQQQQQADLVINEGNQSQTDGHLANLFNPRKNLHRILVLILLLSVTIFNSFCYDSPGALEITIEKVMSISPNQFTSLYSFYCWPNVIICLLGGFLISKILGLRLSMIVFVLFLLFGQLIVALGAYLNEFWLMQLGRFVYGLGGECLTIAQGNYALLWFKDNELSIVFGLFVANSTGSSVLAFFSMQKIYELFQKLNENQALSLTLLIPALLSIIALSVAIFLSILDKRAEIILEDRIKLEQEIRHSSSVSFSGALRNSLKEVRSFKAEFWLLVSIVCTFYICITPFVSLGTGFFNKKWALDPIQAARLDSTAYLCSAFLSPITGFIIDKLGRNLHFILLASSMLLLSHLVLAVLFINPLPPTMFIGFSYAMLECSYWPILPFIIPASQVGLAYGVIQSAQNLGIALGSNFTGYLVDSHGYISVELFLSLCGSIALVFTMSLAILNDHREGVLNMSMAKRKRVN